jgi:hypothetical protein
MDGARFHFSLRRMLIAMTCIAAGTGLVRANLNALYDQSGSALLFFISIPLVSACWGGCVGALTGRFWPAVALGFFGQVAVIGAMVLSILMFY